MFEGLITTEKTQSSRVIYERFFSTAFEEILRTTTLCLEDIHTISLTKVDLDEYDQESWM